MSERGCIRNGGCCQLLGIGLSPRQLREGWQAWDAWRMERDAEWNEFAEKNGTSLIADIWLMYPMLAGRCRGKRQFERDDGTTYFQYYYGPCRNLDMVLEDGKVVPTCAIHENKPYMCSGYPFYADNSNAANRKDPETRNPGFVRGCGYNLDADAGATEAVMLGALMELTPEER